MFKSNNNSIVTNYIKMLLKTEYIPNIPLLKEGVEVYKSQRYIYNNKIIIALQNLSNFTQELYTETNFKTLKSLDNINLKEDYVNYESNTSYYDWLTHFYLGKYLTYLKDFKDINLFHMYNVWAGQYISNYELNLNINNEIILEKKSLNPYYNLLKIDIEANEIYSIFIDSNIPIYMATVAYNNGNLVSDTLYTTKIQYSSQYNQPFTFKSSLNNNYEGIQKQENAIFSDYITLLLQIPKTSQRVLILKGEYKNLPHLCDSGITINDKIVNFDIFKNSLNYNTDEYIDYIPNLNNFLTYTSFSDNFYQYLLDNVIDNKDNHLNELSNIKTVLNSVNYRNNTSSNNEFNMFDEYDSKLKNYIYYIGKKLKTHDNTGYIDKDIEDYILQNSVRR